MSIVVVGFGVWVAPLMHEGSEFAVSGDMPTSVGAPWKHRSVQHANFYL